MSTNTKLAQAAGQEPYTREQHFAQRQPLTEWQPIETAPKDGTRLILSDGKFVGAGVWVGRYFAWGVSPEPTHWMPLPAAPQEPTHG